MKSVALSAAVSLMGFVSLASAFSGPVEVPGGNGETIEIRAPDASNPQCVFDCLSGVTAGPTPCDKGDAKCICTDELTSSTLQTCIAASCDPADVPNAEQYLKWFCD